MEIMNGKELSSKIKDEIKDEVESCFKTPILAVITIGYNAASEVYIKNKKKACEYVGMSLLHFDYVDSVKEKVVINKIKELNEDENVSGIILQLPIPEGFDSKRIINTISPLKDVDGLTESSVSKMYFGEDGLIPCTPKGILELLDHYNISLTGKHVVIVGRSNLVGKPLMIECLKRAATVTVCHSKTENLSHFTSQADILIVATGQKYLIDKDMVKEGSVIVDVGISREDGKLYGDVNPNVSEKCSYLIPVPGGVGPMTVAMLVKNTLIAYKKINNQ